MFLIALAALGAIGSAVSMVMGYQATQAAAKQAKYNAEYNNQLAQNQAEQERLNRAAAENEDRRQKKLRLSLIEAQYAKSGVLLEGTPGLMMQEQATADELSTQQGNLESLQKRRSLRAQGAQALWEGKFQAKQLKTQANIGLIGGLGSLAMQGAYVGMSYKAMSAAPAAK